MSVDGVGGQQVAWRGAGAGENRGWSEGVRPLGADEGQRGVGTKSNSIAAIWLNTHLAPPYTYKFQL